jgi:hypothetical protein
MIQGESHLHKLGKNAIIVNWNQNGSHMNHKQPNSQDTPRPKGGKSSLCFPPYNISRINYVVCIEMTKVPKTPKREF